MSEPNRTQQPGSPATNAAGGSEQSNILQTQTVKQHYRPNRRRFPKASWLTIIGLTLIWVLLWGQASLANLISGFVIAIAVTTCCPLPGAKTGRRFVVRPLAVAKLVTKFFIDIVVASAQISISVLTRRHPQGGIIKVNLRAHSDSFLAATAAMIALIPGSVVINVHRLTGVMYVHVFDLSKPDSAANTRADIHRQEERLLRAFGTREELLDAGFVPGSSTKLGRVTNTPVEPRNQP